MSSDLSLALSDVQAAVTRWFAEDTRQGFFATDREFKVVVWNRWMELHSGHPASEVVGRCLFDLYPDAITRGIQEYYESALAGRVTVISHGLHRHLVRLPATNPDLPFKEMPQSGHIGPLSKGTTVLGTVTIIEDVSERLASESQLRMQITAQQRARATAENALRAKDEFLSTLSHEIRNPLNAVVGWTRILLSRSDIDRALLDRGLHVIERNAQSQAKLIDDMLDMGRIIAGKLRVEMRPVDLVSVVLAAIDVVMPSANAKGIAVRSHLNPRAPHVLGDQDRLQQVVWNLLSNAVKFTEPGGSIDVRLEISGAFARIVVRDTGRGITRDFLPHVFERFRQNDSSSARRYGGLGLGLALVRDLVELHGGTVSAASEGLNRGATFMMELPTIVQPPARPTVEVVDEKEETAVLTGVRVLVVEDESDAREVTAIVLEHSGATVTAVGSSAAGVSAILASSPHALPHVLVSDIGMPGENGYDFIRRVRALDPAQGGTIPAVTVSGYATPEDVDRALAAGYQRHIAKPMDPSVLVAVVTDVIRNAQTVGAKA
jgi:signal transduction histidine kinase/ActR/RegA family two-component response regulator